jgi:hypothetical protein
MMKGLQTKGLAHAEVSRTLEGQGMKEVSERTVAKHLRNECSVTRGKDCNFCTHTYTHSCLHILPCSSTLEKP